MCEHLKKLEYYLHSKQIKESWRGQPWTSNCREWIYFDCILDIEKLKAKMEFDKCVEVHDYRDLKAGTELGFVCNICRDGIIGLHPINARKEKNTVD